MTQALIAGERAGFIAAGIADGPAPSPMFLTLNSGSGQHGNRAILLLIRDGHLLKECDPRIGPTPLFELGHPSGDATNQLGHRVLLWPFP